MTVRLKRISYWQDATLGELYFDGEKQLVTLEPPWRQNKPRISCIPTGVYPFRRCISARFGETFTLAMVPDRSLIRVHWGNVEADTDGCILVGQEFGMLGARNAVLHSRAAFQTFMTLMDGIEETLIEIE